MAVKRTMDKTKTRVTSHRVVWRLNGARDGAWQGVKFGPTKGHAKHAAALDAWLRDVHGYALTDDDPRIAEMLGKAPAEPAADEDDDDPAPTVRDAVVAWINKPGRRGKRKSEGSRTKYGTTLGKLGTLGDVRADQLTRANVSAWFGHWEGEGHATTTLAGMLTVLKGACAQYAPDAFTGIAYDGTATEREGRDLDAAQVAALVTTARDLDPALGLAVWFIAETGVRWGEMAGVAVGDLDVANRTVSINRQVPNRMDRKTAWPACRQDLKGGRNTRRTLPLSGDLTDALALAAALDDKTLPLFDPSGGDGSGWRYSGWKRPWARVKAEAGVPADVWTHDLRHTAAMRWLRDERQSLPVVARKLGDGVDITDRTYSHWLVGDLTAVPVV